MQCTSHLRGTLNCVLKPVQTVFNKHSAILHRKCFYFFLFFFWQHTCEQLFLDQLGLFLRCDMQLVHSASLKGEPWLPVLQREPHKSQDTSSKTNLTMASKAKAEEQPEFQVSPPKWNGDVPEAKHQHVRTATGVSNCWEFIATP